MKAALALGVVPPTHALLETIGRKTGQPWRNPVGNGLADDKTTFWIVAEHGHHAGMSATSPPIHGCASRSVDDGTQASPRSPTTTTRAPDSKRSADRSTARSYEPWAPTC
jgi:hypothetical protein